MDEVGSDGRLRHVVQMHTAMRIFLVVCGLLVLGLTLNCKTVFGVGRSTGEVGRRDGGLNDMTFWSARNTETRRGLQPGKSFFAGRAQHCSASAVRSRRESCREAVQGVFSPKGS